MKKLPKVIRIVLLVILIFVLVVMAAVDIFADRAVKVAIETVATRALNVRVSVGEVDLSIMGGKIGLKNLRIDNPPNYQHDKLLELRDGRIDVEVGSLLGDVVNIKEISLDGVDVVLEQRGVAGNNLQDIVNAISAGEKEKEEGEAEKPGKKLHIDSLEITNVTVNVKLLPVPGKADTVVLKLSPIRMTDLGGDDKLDMAVLSGKIMLAITQGVAEQGVGVLPKEMVDTMKLGLKGTIEVGKAAKEEGEKLIKESTDIGKGILEGFKGLLKSKKDEK